MAGSLDELRARPIPSLGAARAAKEHYRSWPIEKQDEPLIDARSICAGKNYYAHADNPPYLQVVPGSIPELWVRQSVLQMLDSVNAQLKPEGLELFLHDAWRPAAVQYYLHEEWVPGYLRKQHPEWNDAQVLETVGKYWAYGPATDAEIDPASPPPHATGGAIDLTLRTLAGDLLWMGTGLDEVSPRAYTDALEQISEESITDSAAQQNRRLLYWLLREAGFANNPTEWWHYSYGDQMWAKLTSTETGNHVDAHYSNILPE